MSDLVYIVGEFPSVSETFILREMLDLVGRGLPLRIYALRKPRARRVHADCAALMDRVTYRPRPGSAGSLRAHAAMALRRPAAYLSLLACALREGGQDRRRLKGRLAALDAAVGLARAPFAGGIGHLHGHFAGVPATAARYAARLLGVPFSFSAHARDIYVDGKADPTGLAENLRQAAFVVTCTGYNREYLLREFPQVPPEKIHRVYHGIEPERFARCGMRGVGCGMWASAAHSAPPGSASGRISHIAHLISHISYREAVMAVGRLLPKKGLDVLIEACGLLRDRGRECGLVIAGDGPERERLESLARERGVDATTLFLGEVTQEELVPVYAAASIFALPCVVDPGGDRDGLPNVILEAMASGLPVVSTPISGIPEAVEDGVTGLLVPPGDAGALADALERLLGDPALRRRMGEAGAARVRERFDIGQSPLAELFLREGAWARPSGASASGS